VCEVLIWWLPLTGVRPNSIILVLTKQSKWMMSHLGVCFGIRLAGSVTMIGSRRGSIVVFGDSLTQRGFEEGGWVSALAQHFNRRADVYNRHDVKTQTIL